MATARLHPPQLEAYNSTATEILYGGAAGGGKSYLLRVSGIRWALAVPGVTVYLVRSTFPDLEANHLEGPGNFHELLEDYTKAGEVKWGEQKRAFTFKNGSIIKLVHLTHDSDLRNFYGRQIGVLLMDELTHFTEKQYRFLRGRVRLGGLKVPPQYKDRLPRIEAGSNPGSVGHAWVKRSFVSPQAPRKIWRAPKGDGGKLRQFIPARLEDNPTMMETDPDYADTLEGLGTPELVKAMRDGDWDVVAGMAFEMWDAGKHVIDPFEIPPHWTRIRALDWGSSKPFSVGWWAVSDGTIPRVPAGALVRYREWYGCTRKPDTGVRMESPEVARGIKAREADEKITMGVADPATQNKQDGPSTRDRMAGEGVFFKMGDNNRHQGYLEVRARLKGFDGVPMLFVFDTCREFLRTVPVLVMDEHDPEDLDTRQEDHIYDETRYACMSRAFETRTGKPGPKPDSWARAFARANNPVNDWKAA